MKVRYIEEKLTKEAIEALTGKKVGRIKTGELDTADPDIKERGVEIEFDVIPLPAKLTGLDNLLANYKGLNLKRKK